MSGIGARRRRGLEWLALIAGVVGTLRFLWHVTGLLAFPYDVGNGEGLILFHATRIAAGQTMYQELSGFPLVVASYPPLFPIVAAGLAQLLGSTFLATRLVSLFGTVAVAGLIAALVRRGGGSRLASATCGLAYLSSLYVYEWAGWGRVDLMAIAFSLGAVLAATHPGRWGLVGSAGLALLALFTKQTALAAPLAITAWLALRDVRQAAAYAGLLMLPGLALLGLLTWATQGQALVHLIGYQVGLPYLPRALLAQWRALLVTHAFALLAAAGGLVASRRGLAWALPEECRLLAAADGLVASRSWWRRPSLPVLYLLVAMALTLSAGRYGASSNYFLEPFAAALVVAGAWWSGRSSRPWQRDAPARFGPRSPFSFLLSPAGFGRHAVPVLLALQVGWSALFRATPVAQWYPSTWEFTFEPWLADREPCRRIDGWIRGTSGPLLVEDLGWAVRHGRAFPAEPVFVAALSRLDRLQARADLLAAIDAAAFPLAILHDQAFDVELLQHIQARYQVLDRARCVADYTLMMPRE